MHNMHYYIDSMPIKLRMRKGERSEYLSTVIVTQDCAKFELTSGGVTTPLTLPSERKAYMCKKRDCMRVVVEAAGGFCMKLSCPSLEVALKWVQVLSPRAQGSHDSESASAINAAPASPFPRARMPHTYRRGARPAAIVTRNESNTSWVSQTSFPSSSEPMTPCSPLSLTTPRTAGHSQHVHFSFQPLMDDLIEDINKPSISESMIARKFTSSDELAALPTRFTDV